MKAEKSMLNRGNGAFLAFDGVSYGKSLFF
jgi:hypothetical protein